MFIPTEQDVVTFSPGQWYELKYHFVPGVKHESKIWASGDPEPDYQIVDTLDYRWAMQPNVAGSGPILGRYLWLDVRGLNGQAEVDDLKVDLALSDGSEDFGRTEPWGGWGTGELGTWTTTHASYDQYLAVDGAQGIMDQVAPAASGDITLGTNYEFVDPRIGPIEMLFTFVQTGPATGGGGDPFIDDAFHVASDAALAGRWVGIEVFNSPGSQSQTWKIAVDDDRVSQDYVEGAFTPTYGAPINLRILVDDHGTRAKLWMASDPEPASWTSYDTQASATAVVWDPDWIVLQPRQTNRTGTQVFIVDEIEVVTGSRHGS